MSATTAREESHRGDAMPEERHLGRRLIELAVFIGLVAIAIGSLPGFGEVRSRFAEANLALVILIGVMKLGSALSNVVCFRYVFCPRLPWSFTYGLAMAEQGMNVLVPTGGAGGLALGAWALRQGGMSTAHIARRSVAFFLITSAPNFLFAGGLGIVLLSGGLPGDAPAVPTAILTGMAWAAIVMVALVPRLARRLRGWDADRAGRIRRWLRAGVLALADGVADIPDMARRPGAVLGAIGYLSFDIAALLVGFAAFGGVPALGPVVFAYVVGQLGGLIPLPGGIGGTDGGLIGALVLYGVSLPRAAAAVLAYRAFQLGLPAVLGALAYVGLRRRLAMEDSPAAVCAPLAG